MKRRLAVGALAVVALAAIYLLLLRDSAVAPTVTSPQPMSAIGAGSDAVAVSADGTVLSWLPAPADSSLPLLPLSKPPASGRLQGTALQQARVLGAAPAALRPYLQSSYYGESGVDVNLKAGVELRFGDASQAARKWRAAAAILANPSVTTLDYVDLHAPSRPAIGGSGHTLPSVP
jgi:cell division protein FtsQ